MQILKVNCFIGYNMPKFLTEYGVNRTVAEIKKSGKTSLTGRLPGNHRLFFAELLEFGDVDPAFIKLVNDDIIDHDKNGLFVID